METVVSLKVYHDGVAVDTPFDGFRDPASDPLAYVFSHGGIIQIGRATDKGDQGIDGGYHSHNDLSCHRDEQDAKQDHGRDGGRYRLGKGGVKGGAREFHTGH